jgi:Plasmid pRiA4b ORF-3-like protein
MPTPNSVAVYQPRIRLDRSSPLIWRRLLVTEATTIAELHAIIQIAFGWNDSHLHQFIIHSKPYGIAYLGGVSFADNPDQVRLADFHFRRGERFFYEYNFHVPWRHEICIVSRAQHLPAYLLRVYPLHQSVKLSPVIRAAKSAAQQGIDDDATLCYP